MKNVSLKSYLLFDFKYMTLWKGQNYEDSKKHLWLPGVCGEKDKDEWANIEDFQGCENTLYDTIMMNTCHYPLVQI